MLDARRVAEALAAKQDLFAGYEAERGATLERYRGLLVEAAGLEAAELEARLAGCERPGARPTVELDECRSPVIPFGPRWRNHEEARAWARQTLEGQPTIAVDGSQISPSGDLSLPVGAVQVAWFENPHDSSASYVKDVSFEVLAPQELARPGEDGGGFPDWEVNWRRFQGECLRLGTSMEAARARVPRPVCLFDGSLVVSFVQHMEERHQRLYMGAVQELLEASAGCRVPVVGYVDGSDAADLVAMLDALYGSRGGRASDAAVLAPLMAWGDRTPAWTCARDDQVAARGMAGYYEQVAFVYLKTAAGNPPARLEFPRWLLDAGQLERVVDVVRAECIVGNGYPYAIETADAAAVITAQDRERFHAALQRFAAQHGLPLYLRRKAGSKRGRR